MLVFGLISGELQVELRDTFSHHNLALQHLFIMVL